MAISVTDPIGLALTKTKQILFKPFVIGKWFTLGFCAWLAYLGEGVGSFNFPGGGGGGRGGGAPGPFGPQPSAPTASDWWANNASWLIPLIGVGVILVIALIVLLTWLQSRGKFMFLDGVIHNRGAVVEPWKRFRTLGNSLFGFQLMFTVCILATFAIISGIGAGIAWPDIQAEQFGTFGVIAIIFGVLMVLITAITVGIISFLLGNFVVPAMYLRDERVMAAWSTVRREVLPGNAGAIVLYLLMKIVLGIAMGVIGILATCLTCCIAALPYIGAVILLPLSVFWMAYSLHFLEQFGPQWKIFPDDDYPRCNICQYNLTGNVSGICPECGTPIQDMPPAPPTTPQGPPLA